MRELAFRHRRFGYRRLCVLLRREFVVNHKRVYRLYREEGLKIRTKRRKKRYAPPRMPLATPAGINQRWSVDFVSPRPCGPMARGRSILERPPLSHIQRRR